MSQAETAHSEHADQSKRVRDFYDQYPYPRPIDNLEAYKHRWQDIERRQAEFHLLWPDRTYREDFTILIAGCGTSQAAKHALRWPRANVVGIDCSGTSVAYTEQLKKTYNLENLHVRQLALERVSGLNMTFDQIVCTGVLHHLPDPNEGLRALRSVLKPDGAMHLMVYAPYGRAGIYMMQEFSRRVGIHPGERQIRDFISALQLMPKGHPLQSLLSQAPDFRNEAELADALLHPQDRAYSVSQLFDWIESAGLQFGRWIRQAPYSVNCGVIARLPQVSQIANLPVEEQYASIELFRGTMVNHSCIVYDRDSQKTPVSFDGDKWLNYVPVRMPDTLCIQDRVPAGCAAVLINCAHRYTDLLLPISSLEKKIYAAVDSQRTIKDIMQSINPSVDYLKIARTFFDRLWSYDQVVFNTTQRCD